MYFFRSGNEAKGVAEYFGMVGGNHRLRVSWIRDITTKTELLQEKADDLERVKRYADEEQMFRIFRMLINFSG